MSSQKYRQAVADERGAVQIFQFTFFARDEHHVRERQIRVRVEPLGEHALREPIRVGGCHDPQAAHDGRTVS